MPSETYLIIFQSRFAKHEQAPGNKELLCIISVASLWLFRYHQSMIDDFLAKNWFDLLQSAFIVGGFALTFLAARSETRSRKLEHLFHLNQSHREIWNKTYSHPELLRIRKTEIDLQAHPITETERRLVKEVIIHVNVIYEAMQNGDLKGGELKKDIHDFFQLPIPNSIWQKVKVYHNKEFVHFIEQLLI